MVVHTAIARVTKDEATGEKWVNQYRLLELAGRGQFCKVKWADDAEGRVYAVKKFYKGVLENQFVSKFDHTGASSVPLRERIDEELRILGALQHPGIVALVEVINDPNVQKMYSVMEGLRGGQLMDWDTNLSAYTISSQADAVRQAWGDRVEGTVPAAVGGSSLVFREEVAAFLFRQVLGAVEYLHGHQIVHKDLKPDNILLSAPVPSGDSRFASALDLSGWPALVAPSPPSTCAGDPAAGLLRALEPGRFVAKLGDFNSAVACPTAGCTIYDAEGTQLFTPPECFFGDKNIQGKPRDMWSMGCVLFVMLFGRCPFWALEPIDLQIRVMQEELTLPAGVLSAGVAELIRSLLQKEPGARPVASAVLENAWVIG